MILAYILAAIGTLIAIIVYFNGDWDASDEAAMAFFICFFVFGIPWLILQGYGMATRSKSENITYPVPIVTLNDGKGMKGRISGGMFVIRGSFEDTQHFSYYRKEADGSFLLEKRPATASKIWLDATPETARVDITDKVYTCKGGATWWFVGCGQPDNSFVAANFHIPADSIINEFELDAE